VNSTVGAIATDASSHAYLFRWAEFNLTGQGGVIPVYNASATATYEFQANQTNFATANTVNNISANNSAVYGYLQYWDSVHGFPGYGHSNAKGVAALLLASNSISGGSGPDGWYLGDYNITVGIQRINTSQNFDWGGISPYPAGVAVGTAGYGMADFGPGLNFPGYFARLTLLSAKVSANGIIVANGIVRIGQTLGANLTLNDTGAAPITSVSAVLFYNLSGLANRQPILDSVNLTPNLTVIGTHLPVNLGWLVNDLITGTHGKFSNTFYVDLVWNGLLPSLGGNATLIPVNVTIAPSQVKVTFQPLLTSNLAYNTSYLAVGVLTYNGSMGAVVQLIATPTGGGASIVLVSRNLSAGPYDLNWSDLALNPGTPYSLIVKATYNGVTNNSTVQAGPFVVAAPPSSSSNFFTKTFLGLPVWLWLAIVAAIIVAVVLFLVFVRRGAAGKLVECGECGALIPEAATSCPKCGAEFESDLVRCSRCASTIPAASTSCPECSAQLLGKPATPDDEAARQAYEDFLNRFRAEGRKELGDNYTEDSFWDWWKRQPTYTPFSQWKLQQGQGSRVGMTAPPPDGAAPGAPEPAATKPRASAAPTTPSTTASRPSTAPPPAAKAPPSSGLKACPSCGKEIPPEYLVCPFCGSVTQ
jgi:RNA polymerase subunit RPABC4/transcription elongation factor Spt4